MTSLRSIRSGSPFFASFRSRTQLISSELLARRAYSGRLSSLKPKPVTIGDKVDATVKAARFVVEEDLLAARTKLNKLVEAELAQTTSAGVSFNRVKVVAAFSTPELSHREQYASYNTPPGSQHGTKFSRQFSESLRITRSPLFTTSPAISRTLTKPQPVLALHSRQVSTIVEARLAILEREIGLDTKIDLRQILDDLSDLELLDKLRGVVPKSAVSFAYAARALYPLYHKVDQDPSKIVRFADLKETLPVNMSVPWTVIGERLHGNTPTKLLDASDRERVCIKLMQVFNTGAKRANLYYDLGARQISDLTKLDSEGKIKLNKGQKIGIRLFEDFNRLIPRTEMQNLKTALEKTILSADSRFECEILGSFRRGLDFGSDIDLAVRHEEFADNDDKELAKALMTKIVSGLEDAGLILRENLLMNGDKKYAGLIKLPNHPHFRRIDIRLAPYDSYPYFLLGGSGDAMLMKFLRHTAKARGLCLNEFGMGAKHDAIDQNPNGFKPGTMKIVESEKEIFELLKFPYLAPEEREQSIWTQIYRKAGIDISYIDKL